MASQQYTETVYYGGAYEAEEDFQMGQGFSSMSRDGEILISNREWERRCMFFLLRHLTPTNDHSNKWIVLT